MNVLVINAGSSSVKYQLFEMVTESILAKGVCDRIGIDGHMKHTPVSSGKPVFDGNISLPTHTEAVNAIIDKLTSKEYGVIDDLSEIKAIGHRIVHGGSKFSTSVLIDAAVLSDIKSFEPLAPLHTPANLIGIDACTNAMPNVPQVAVFDTAFHQTIPDYAYTYSIPYKYYEKNDIRRYGFHGTSHRYVSAIANEYLGNKTDSKIITCHLGNGASLAAIRGGKCIDTTMGVTPLEGLPMGTRSGSVDPTLIEIIAELDGLTLEEVLDILNKKSGVLGVSGVSSDFRDVETAAGIDIPTGRIVKIVGINERCKLALDIFNYQVAKYIGAYFIIMGGLDALVFTAGVGENSAYTRKGICSLLNGVGIRMNESTNQFRGASELVDITDEGSTAKVLMIPTNEELVIARDTKEIVG